MTVINGKYKHKPKMSKEEVIEELRRLEESGHSMRTGDFEPWFYRRIVQHFGGYKNALKELEITQAERRPGSGISTRDINDVIRELKLNYGTITDTSVYHTEYRHLYDYSYRRYGDGYKIFDTANLERPSHKEKRKRRKKYWTEERIVLELDRAIKELGSVASRRFKVRGYSGLVDAVRRHYGSWNAGLVANGYEVAHSYRMPDEKLTKEDVKSEVLMHLNKGISPSNTELRKCIKGFNTSYLSLFNGMEDLREYCGICAIWESPPKEKEATNVYRPNLQTVEGVKREIIRMWYIGVPLNYKFVSSRKKSIISASNNLIGSWRSAVESVGIEYTEVSKSTNTLSECGEEFEEVFADILTEIGFDYSREGKGLEESLPGFNLKPDFILPNWRWIDCKLSEWTDFGEMLKKYYTENPNGITVVYLRGRKTRKYRGYKYPHEHVSVYKFTEELPENRRVYYEGKLREIERKASKDIVAD